MNPKSQTDDINQRDKLYYAMGGKYPCKDEAESLKELAIRGFQKKDCRKSRNR